MSRLILQQPRRAYVTYASLIAMELPGSMDLSDLVQHTILPCWGVPEHAFVCRWDEVDERRLRLDIVPQGYDLAADGRVWEDLPLEDWSPHPEVPRV